MRGIFALILAIALPVQALAQVRLSSTQLTEGSLLGQIASTAQLQNEFDAHSALIAQATEDLGLTRGDFLYVRHAIALGEARYVVIPRHLDGMAGQSGGRPFVLRNVTIPANEYGWEVDVPKPNGTVEVFVPNKCGNVSYLRTATHYPVAAVYVVPAPVVAVSPLPPPAFPVPPAAIATSAPVAFAPPMIVAAPAAASAHLAWLGLLLLPIIGSLVGHGGGSTSPAAVAPVPTPIPIHTICPGPTARIR
ncbi:MAG TPA: hypothetical protein VMD47_08575 [Candidatus Acidoferrales bacterium]|nr:hypothetical protein [Candidatus Acidoferrales bacterium]